MDGRSVSVLSRDVIHMHRGLNHRGWSRNLSCGSSDSRSLSDGGRTLNSTSKRSHGGKAWSSSGRSLSEGSRGDGSRGDDSRGDHRRDYDWRADDNRCLYYGSSDCRRSHNRCWCPRKFASSCLGIARSHQRRVVEPDRVMVAMFGIGDATMIVS